LSILFAIVLAFSAGGRCLTAQIVPAQPAATQTLAELAATQDWEEIVRLAGAIHMRSAEEDFFYGSALAHLDRLAEAERALQAGAQLAPSDARFAVELAGIAFRQKHYASATQRLRRSLKLAPGDSYANDFLGTVYFLQGNLVASLKYWNYAGKPQIANVEEEPPPDVSPALLDRAFAFSPASLLTLPQFLDTETRIRGLGIFPQSQFDLRARDDGKFDLVFRNQERNGLGASKLEALSLFLRDVPFQGVTPEYDNIGHQAINVTSLFRWDAQKRRIFAEFSGPFEHSAKYRYALVADLRNENWAIRDSFTGIAPVLASLNLRRELVDFDIGSCASDRLGWKVGGEFSHRDYRGAVPGTVLTSLALASGYQLKQNARVAGTVWRIPERRFAVNAEARSQAARLWSQPFESSEKISGTLGWHWLPQAEGDDYEMRQQVRAGKTFGQVPFDEMFMLGLERDNDLPMHAHIGTRDGLKGSAPLGRNYFLHSWEGDKNIYSNGLIAVKLGPLLDIGKITNPGTALGSHDWLFDAGAQVKLRVFSTTVAFSYGRDLRAGHNALYAALLP
jgi:tetratricopeptide (TPR) repeat protein